MMRVQLLNHNIEMESIAATAARLCYSASSIEELMDKDSFDHVALLEKVIELGHYSVLEHAVLSFGVEGISRACSHQLVRHRLASYSQQSQRYVSHKERFEAVTPPSVADVPALAERFESVLDQIHEAYREMIEAGIPAEDARFLLPNAATTKIIITMNARELRHFFALRCCRRAQWEIQAMAKEMLRQARLVAPILFAKAGPGCLDGPCPEGRMTCGAVTEVRQEFSEL